VGNPGLLHDALCLFKRFEPRFRFLDYSTRIWL